MLNIYYGRESINKEKFVYSRIAARGYSAQRPVLVIVPDQYTLEAERQAFRFSGVESLLGLDVYSMSRLGHAILEEMGGDRETFIDRYGRQMLLTRIAREEEESLNVFRGNMKRNAFISLTNDFISELKQYGLAPDDLAAVRDAVPSDRLLHRKLSDLTRIYERYQAEIEGKYTDSEDYIDLYIGKIGSSRYVRNASVWVYGFDSFAPKSLKVLGGLMAAAEDVNVVMTADRQCRDEALFSLAWTVIGNLRGTAAENGCEIEQVAEIRQVAERGGEDFVVQKEAPEILHLEKEIFATPSRPWKGEAPAITICEAANVYNEAESAAAFVLHLLRDCGYRRRDIVLICNDQKLRASIAERVFGEYGLPLFRDSKRGILNAGMAVCLVSLLETIDGKYRTTDVFKTLKSGFLPLTQEETEKLEIYARKYRIRGAIWKKPFQKGISEYGEKGLAEIEAMREKAIRPFLVLEELVRSASNVKEFTVGFYWFLTEELGILSSLRRFIVRQTEEGLPALASETEQIWSIVCGILDQIQALIGEDPFSLSEYVEMLRAGLDQIEVGVLPSSIDDLILGTMQRTRAAEAKALVVLGANEGVLPAEASPGGLFALEELSELADQGYVIAKADQVRIAEERMAIYRNLSKPAAHLWIGYSTGDEEGKELRRSEVVDDMLRIFPDLSVSPDILSRGLPEDLVGGKASTLRHLTQEMRRGSRSGAGLKSEDLFWNLVEVWFRKEAPEQMARIDRALEFENGTSNLSDDLKRLLFRDGGEGKDVLSPSRIETYAKCPFQYFVHHGLKPMEEREFRIDSRAIGDVYHECLMEAAQQLSREGTWETVTRDECAEIVDRAVHAITGQYREGLFVFTGEERYKTERIRKTCFSALWMLIQQARDGSIPESAYEIGFGEGREIPAIEIPCGDRTVLIEGKIDRLDILENGRIKIMDYKSGENSLDLNEVRAGYRLQLMLYMKAAREGHREPAGVFYFHIQDPRAKETDPEALQTALRQAFLLKGILVNADQNVEEICGDFSGKSEVTGITLKKDGGLSGNKDCALMTDEEFAELTDAVDDKLSELAQQMEAGEIPIRPMRSGTSTPCTYCDYRGTCRFDLGFAENRYRNV